MIRLLLIVLFALLIGTGLSLGLQYDLGYIRISLGQYLIETNFWVGLALLIALVALIVLTIGMIRRMRQGGGLVANWVSRGKERRARRRTTQGLLALAEGNWPRARKMLTSGAGNADTPLINYLAAAQAAFECGDHQAVDELLRKAYESTPGSDMAVGITQAQLQLAGNRQEQALATLVRLRKQSPHHPFVLKLLKNTYLRLEDWRELAKLLPELRKRSVLPENELGELERQVWHNLLERAAEDCRRQQKENPNTSLEPLTRLWDELPGFLRRDEKTIGDYARLLANLGDEEQTETLLRKVLHNHWSDDLVNLYGRIEGRKPDEQLLAAEQWLKDRPNNAELLLALGRLSLRNELWGKAREYFETSLRLRRSREGLAELSRLSAHMGDEEMSIKLMMQGLANDNGLPKLPMPKA
ncbi:MAG: heme biosynthesis protein HemY [Marinobacter sp.]|uniref:heme biosynthesis HemY N-terminal domain-containing protein n=1 Tax=Marinobacter sp. TaxID=50741 RepID=UPI001B6CC73E|nr:heme biosynthesis HemY N-terminal domain-containing protein [Marinobacter sp.]MBQ0747620.1 heme biosynthesis protein HemY [Marinobacter sp.]MBQ0813790.1 heme biosynthesis protein HemY [Marinobacter sp.]|tara:strand:+ start:4682 stop:5923 length:1242 start_codon:yes stop_codon:yes gene_type:complete